MVDSAYNKQDFVAVISNLEVERVLKNYFGEFSDALIKEMVSIGHLLEVNAQETVIQQGHLSQDVFLLVTGRLRVVQSDQYEEEHRLNEIAAGEFFGEMALFTGEPRTVSIRAIRQSTLLKIEGAVFQDFLDSHIDVVKYLGATLIRRLSQSNKGPVKRAHQKNICIIPLQANYPIRQFCERLQKELKPFGSSLAVNKERAISDEVWNDAQTDSEKTSRFSQWLYPQELNYEFVLLEGEYSATAWMATLIGQADLVVLVGSLNADGSLSPVEDQLIKATELYNNIDQLLVLDSLADSEIKNTAKHLGNRFLKTFLHLNKEEDYARIGRFLSGNAIKLVLGGGGARGFAHLGVFKALRELNIPVDFVGGTSIGSIAAALVASGWDYERIIKDSYWSFVTAKPLSDYQMPLVSLLRGNKLERTLEKSFGDLKIEDLPIPYYAIAANLSKGCTEIMDNGFLKKAVRASISLPSILPPTVYNNSLLLDGGIVDNLPYDHMSTLAEGFTIGVDLAHSKERELGYKKVPSNRKILMGKYAGGKKYKVPNIYQVIMGTMTLASSEKRKENIKKFDVYLQPDVARFGFLNMKKFHEIVEEGYQSSLPQLREWKEKSFLNTSS
ncbi:patatin-like phospholipase domain-containing protein [Chitinophagales bacterium]|nr:patatin-like phospholipase domain-containing protein [Chitinophagales bacterium]